MERVLAAGMTVATLLLLPALLSTPSPAGACSLWCPGDAQDLSGVTVTQLSGDDDAVAPEWPEEGRMNVNADGTPESLSLEGYTVNMHAAEEE